jgi:hypothetical protein
MMMICKLFGKIPLAILMLCCGMANAQETLQGDQRELEAMINTISEASKSSSNSGRDPGETEFDRGDVSDAESAEQPHLNAITPELVLPPEGANENSEPEMPEAPQVEPANVPLSPEMEKLKWKVRDALMWHYEHPQRTTDRSPWGIMHAMLPYGVDSRIVDANGRLQNAVGYLCYNNSCRGMKLFHLKQGRIAAEIGPGRQGHQGQFLAMLAQSRVSLEYPMKIEGKSFTVRDLLEYEKATCEPNTELTFKLIAFAHYLPHDATWKNQRGESWDFSRLIREELKQPVIGAACGGTHRMMGFSQATRIHESRKLPLVDQWLRAEQYRDNYHHYAFSLQNRDGTFSTEWFEKREARPDLQRRLQTTGHILEWMVYSLPQEELTDARIVRSVDYVAELLNQGRNVKWEIGPLGHALHALALYDERLFNGKPGERSQQLAQHSRSSQGKQKK